MKEKAKQKAEYASNTVLCCLVLYGIVQHHVSADGDELLLNPVRGFRFAFFVFQFLS